jgi:arylsulfatase A-like enzyme
VPSTRGCPARRFAVAAACAALVPAAAGPAAADGARPNVVVVTVDTLRADSLSAYGYSRPTSPAIDRLLRSGALFADARTVEPLTAPALISMLTSLEPDVHGASRNALPMHAGLESLGTHLRRHGYRSAAFVSSWILRSRLTGLADHFDSYQEILTRKRWWGLVGEEASAAQVNEVALRWLGRAAPAAARRAPLLLWVHYVDPHAPYKARRRFAQRLGVSRLLPPARDRYDTEVAYVDAHVGELVEALSRETMLGANTLFVFASDHGESLGEHGTWGHGRNLYEEAVRIPLGFAWSGRLAPLRIEAPASILDVAPTVLGLLGLAVPEAMAGFDWSGVFAGAPAPDRPIWLQAHQGVALGRRRDRVQRLDGLLELGVVFRGHKQSWRLAERQLLTFDLRRDARELDNLTGSESAPPPHLDGRLRRVVARLGARTTPGPELDAAELETLRALGYLR